MNNCQLDNERSISYGDKRLCKTPLGEKLVDYIKLT